MKHISQDIINKISMELIKEFSPKKVYLFGSYAWGVPTKESDLDFLVLVDESSDSSTQRATRAYRTLRDFRNYSIDVLVRTTEEFEPFTNLKASFQYKIHNEGQLLYEQ